MTVNRSISYILRATALSAALSTQAQGQPFDQFTLIYTQPMEGVYTQDWFAQSLGQRDGPSIDVYVVGVGKAGDFFGVISVDCDTPSQSEWIASGGYLSPDRVPDAVVRGIRKLACAG